MANLVPVKGHLDFIEMARTLLDAGTRAEFCIVGDDIHQAGYRELLERRVRELGLDDIVTFVGFRRDVPAVLRELTVLVCSSHVEPFGRSIIEAMAAGVPVVATRVGGIPEIIEDRDSGLLVPPRDPAALASAVTRLLDDPELRRRLTASARRRVESSFSAAAQVDRILGLYRGLSPLS